MICNSVSCKVFAVALLLCVGLSVQEIRPSRAELVEHFEVSEAKDWISWRAYGRTWKVIDLQLSAVVEHNQHYFHGMLEGEADSIVSLTLLPGMEFSGMIITFNETWWLQPIVRQGDGIVDLYMYKESALNIDPTLIPVLDNPVAMHGHEEAGEEQGTAGSLPVPVDPNASSNEGAAAAESGDNNAAATARTAAATATSTTTPQVTAYKVAVFVDQMWAATSNPWRSMTDTVGLFNDVNAIYKAAGLKEWTVVYQKQVNNAHTTLTDMLTDFSNTQSTSLSAFKDTSFTTYAWLVGTNVGGLTYVGTACKASNAQNRKTSVCGLANYSRLFTVKTIAHELGHNRGAPHDFTNQCASGVKTNCQCSVMSYCFPTATNNPLGAKNVFSTNSINSIKSAGCT